MDFDLFDSPELPKDRLRLLACRIDSYAQNRGADVYASVPRSSDISQGFRDITWNQLVHTIDKTSWWLEDQLGPSDNSFECIAYLGPNDLGYMVMVVAAIKTGRKLFLPSPLLSPAALTQLLSRLKCNKIICSRPLPKNTWFETLSQQYPGVHSYEVPDIMKWFDLGTDACSPYLYTKSWDEAINDPVLVLHTSGTTGTPQPIVYTKSWDEAINDPVLVLHTSGTTGTPQPIGYHNSTFAYFDLQYRLGQVGPSLAINHNEGKRMWCPTSMAHLSGLYTYLFNPVYYGTIAVLSPSGLPVTVDLSDQMIQYGNVSIGVYPPFLLEDIASKPASLKLTLERLETIGYGTAPLNRVTGDMLCKNSHVQPHYASTECPFLPYLRLSSEDWEYFSFHPLAGVEFCHRQGDLFELIVIRKEKLEEFQVVFTVLPDTNYFYSGDLWSPHTTKQGLWRYRGRTDDIIVLSSGMKVHTTPIESAIQEDPRVRAAVVGGSGKFHPFLLLEMTKDFYSSVGSPKEKDIQQQLWPAVKAINERLQLHPTVSITKSYVVIAPAETPFARLAKGSVDRRNTIKLFEPRIEQCFRNTAE